MPSSSSRETLLRQWRLLALVPRYPHTTTVAAAQRGLADDGFAMRRRTVERDLQKLSAAGFPLLCERKSGRQQWSLLAQRDGWLPSPPSVSNAVLLVLARDYLTPLLPPLMRQALAPTFAQAEDVLTTARAVNHLARWRDKVRATLPSQALLAPKIPHAIHQTCTDALLREHQLTAQYESRSRNRLQTLTLNPLGLLQRGLVSYLVATAPPHADPRLYALHRFRKVRVLDTPAMTPAGFTLDGFLAQGFADFGRGAQVRMRLRVSPSVAAHLAECRLSLDQTITRVRTPSGWFRVKATVNDTPQLRWWIRGFGADVEVESPALPASLVGAGPKLRKGTRPRRS